MGATEARARGAARFPTSSPITSAKCRDDLEIDQGFDGRCRPTFLGILDMRDFRKPPVQKMIGATHHLDQLDEAIALAPLDPIVRCIGRLKPAEKARRGTIAIST